MGQTTGEAQLAYGDDAIEESLGDFDMLAYTAVG